MELWQNTDGTHNDRCFARASKVVSFPMGNQCRRLRSWLWNISFDCQQDLLRHEMSTRAEKYGQRDLFGLAGLLHVLLCDDMRKLSLFSRGSHQCALVYDELLGRGSSNCSANMDNHRSRSDCPKPAIGVLVPEFHIFAFAVEATILAMLGFGVDTQDSVEHSEDYAAVMKRDANPLSSEAVAVGQNRRHFKRKNNDNADADDDDSEEAED